MASYRGVKGRISLTKSREAAIRVIKRYLEEHNEHREDGLRVVLQEVVFRTGAILGYLICRKKGYPTCEICTHTANEIEALSKDLGCGRQKLSAFMATVDPHLKKCHQPLQIVVDESLSSLLDIRDQRKDEFEQIANLIIFSLWEGDNTWCRILLLLGSITSNELAALYQGLENFANELIEKTHPQDWPQRRASKDLLYQESSVSLPLDFGVHMMAAPEGSQEVLFKVQDKLQLRSRDASSYSVYLLWPDRFVSTLPSFRHCPTESQLSQIHKILGNEEKIETFKMITWPRTGGICNRVAGTKMPYYSKDWRNDLEQIYKDFESKVLIKKSIFQIPILYKGVMLAIIGVNTQKLTLDQQLQVYEIAMLCTQEIYESIKTDIARAMRIEGIRDEHIRNLRHDLKYDLCKTVQLDIDEWVKDGVERGDKVEISYQDLRATQLMTDYMVELIDIYSSIRKGYEKWLNELKGKIKIADSRVNILEVIKNAKTIVETIKDNPPCDISATESDITVFAQPTLLLTVFVNLIHNSKKTTDDSGQGLKNKPIQIQISREENMAVIKIKDKAGGFDADAEKRFLNRHLPSGSGLKIVCDLVDAHGGKIDLKNNEGTGCTFIINLPIANEREE